MRPSEEELLSASFGARHWLGRPQRPSNRGSHHFSWLPMSSGCKILLLKTRCTLGEGHGKVQPKLAWELAPCRLSHACHRSGKVIHGNYPAGTAELPGRRSPLAQPQDEDYGATNRFPIASETCSTGRNVSLVL